MPSITNQSQYEDDLPVVQLGRQRCPQRDCDQTNEIQEQLRQDDWRLFRDMLRHHPHTDPWIADLSAEGALTAAVGWYRANRRPDAPPRPPLPDVSAPTLGA